MIKLGAEKTRVIVRNRIIQRSDKGKPFERRGRKATGLSQKSVIVLSFAEPNSNQFAGLVYNHLN